MTQFNDRPIPQIDPQKCNGCELCVRVCPTKALELRDGKAVVANPLACEYSGLCEAVCPTQAITRPFEIVVACADNEEKTPSNSTKVIEKDPSFVYNENDNKI
jgi:ferredoxin